MLNMILYKYVCDVTPIETLEWDKTLSQTSKNLWIPSMVSHSRSLKQETTCEELFLYSHMLLWEPKAYQLFDPVKQDIICKRDVFSNQKNLGITLLIPSFQLLSNDSLEIIENIGFTNYSIISSTG
jgi:hypothetical protein